MEGFELVPTVFCDSRWCKVSTNSIFYILTVPEIAQWKYTQSLDSVTVSDHPLCPVRWKWKATTVRVKATTEYNFVMRPKIYLLPDIDQFYFEYGFDF